MNSGNTSPANPAGGPGTPIFDELTSAYPAAAEPNPSTFAPEAAVSAPLAAADLVQPAAILDLFMRMTQIEQDDGSWNAYDVLYALTTWFAEFGIDVETDVVAAAQSLRVPAWLASMLTASVRDDSDLIIHVRTEHPEPLDSARDYLGALVHGLGETTSASVFDVAGDQIAHLGHPDLALPAH